MSKWIQINTSIRLDGEPLGIGPEYILRPFRSRNSEYVRQMCNVPYGLEGAVDYAYTCNNDNYRSDTIVSIFWSSRDRGVEYVEEIKKWFTTILTTEYYNTETFCKDVLPVSQAICQVEVSAAIYIFTYYDGEILENVINLRSSKQVK